MKKVLPMMAIVLGMHSTNVFAQQTVVVTGVKQTQPQGNYNLGAVTPGSIPNGTMYGTSYDQQAYNQQQKARAAAKAQCEDSVRQQVLNSCTTQADTILRDDVTSCNTKVAAGSAVGAVGGIAAGAAAGVAIASTAPVSVPVMIIGSLGLVGLGGGTYVAANGANQCKDQANWNHDDNLKTCARAASDAAKKSCSNI